MLPYVILFAIFAFAAIRAGLNPARQPRWWILIAVAGILIIFVGLRYEVGADWYNYLYLYNKITRGSLSTALATSDPGYALLNWIAGQAGLAIWFPNLICATLFTWGLIAFCRQQPNPALALAVAVYVVVLVGMGYTRQSAALGLVMLAISQHLRGQTVRMAISLLFALTFHSSSAVMIPVLALAAAGRGIGTLLTAMLLGLLLLYQFYGSLVVLVGRYTDETFVAAGAVPRLLLNLIPALIFLSIPRRLSLNPAEVRLWSIFALLTFVSVAGLFLVNSSTIVDRLGLYLAPLQIFVWSRLPAAFGSGSRQNMLMMSGILVYSFAIEMAWLTYGHWGYAWLPYQNYLWETVGGRAPPPWFYDLR